MENPTPLPVQPLPTDQTIVQASPKQQSNVFPVALVGIICAVLFGLGGYYVGHKNSASQLVADKNTTEIQNATAIPTTATQITTPVVTTPVDPTATWESYTGTEYSFKHPAGINSDTGAAGAQAESIRFSFMGQKQIDSGRTQTELADGYMFVVTKIDAKSEKTPEQWARERMKANQEDNCGPDVVFSDIKPVQLGTSTGVQYTVRNCRGDYTSSYISNGKYIYEVTQLYVGDAADQKGYEETTNQIFSTLKFF